MKKIFCKAIILIGIFACIPTSWAVNAEVKLDRYGGEVSYTFPKVDYSPISGTYSHTVSITHSYSTVRTDLGSWVKKLSTSGYPLYGHTVTQGSSSGFSIQPVIKATVEENNTDQERSCFVDLKDTIVTVNLGSMSGTGHSTNYTTWRLYFKQAAGSSKVTVALDSNGGTDAKPNKVYNYLNGKNYAQYVANSGGTWVFPTTTRDGCIFDAWYTKSDYSDANGIRIDETTKTTAKVNTIVAHWFYEAPHNFTATDNLFDKVSLSWEPIIDSPANYNIYRSDTDECPTTPKYATATMSFDDMDTEPGHTYYYWIKAQRNDMESVMSDPVVGSRSMEPEFPKPDLSNYEFTMVGYENGGVEGSYDYDEKSGVFTVRGCGSDVWNSQDHFSYLYRPVSEGDFSLTVKMDDFVADSNGWAKAGLMLREGDSEGGFPDDSRYVIIHTQRASNPSNSKFRSSWRNSKSYNVSDDCTVVGADYSYPNWQRIERVGNVVSCYYSGNGKDWTLLSETDTETWKDGSIGSDLPLYVGMFVTSHNSYSSDARAYFSEVSFTGEEVIIEAPTITEQPVSQNVTEGDTVILSVKAIGNNLTYQWLKDEAELIGATSSTYTIESAELSDAGSYTVTVSNSAGSVTSNEAVLTVESVVIEAPAIIVQPVSQTVVEGESVTFSVVAEGSNSSSNADFSVPLSSNVNLDMVWINPGTFIMGSPEDEMGRQINGQLEVVVLETQHEVTLTKGYWLGKYEVTQAQYKALTGKNPSRFVSEDKPVECVTWYEAIDFCTALTELERAAGRLPEGYEYSLPTEAQWEYACRAGTTTACYNGKGIPTEEQRWEQPCPNVDPMAWYYYNGGYTTHPVGQKQPNGWGLYDMYGNVWEWCWDWFGYDYYINSPATDPMGPSTGEYRCARGGSWGNGAYRCRSATREYDRPPTYNQNGYIGFRVALVPVQAQGTDSLSYQWYKDGEAINGATSSTYTIESAELSDAGSYTVTVSNSAGSVTSNEAVLTVEAVVIESPTIIVQPVSQTVMEGENVTFSVVAEGGSADFSVPLSEKVNLDLVWIEPGTYTMGSPEDELGRGGNETQTNVTITNGFWMGKYEVTQAQYEIITKKNPSNNIGDNNPVENVSKYDADGFCSKLTEIEKAAGRLPDGYKYALPTEAQWEYACRAGTTTALNSGKNLTNTEECPNVDEVGWYKCNSDGKTNPIGQKRPNNWGLYDMHGNVWEWCSDRYHSGWYFDPICYGAKGGSYTQNAENCRSATHRQLSQHTDRQDPMYSSTYNDVGFRVILVSDETQSTSPVSLTYQWYKDGEAINGATDSTYTIESAELSDAGSYTVTVSNSTGSVTSNAATLIVNSKPTGTGATISMSSRNPVTYGASCGALAGTKVGSEIWGALLYNGQVVAIEAFAHNAAGEATGKLKGNVIGTDLVPAGTDVIFQLAAFDQGYIDHPDIGNYYYGISAPFTYHTGDASNPFVLPDVHLEFESFTIEKVNVPEITTQPKSQTVNEGDTVTFSVTAIGTAPLSYQWKKNGDAIDGATASSYTISSAKISDEGSYTVTVSNSFGSVISEAATLIVNHETHSDGTAVRSVEVNGQTATVTLALLPNEDVNVYFVEETVPNVGTIVPNNGGVYTPSKNVIRWSFLDGVAREVSYTVTVPGDVSEKVTVSGEVAFDTTVKVIEGETELDFTVKTHPADTNDDFEISMLEVSAYAVAWKQGKSWSREPSDIPMNYVARAALIWINGGDYIYDSSKAQPACWVNAVAKAASEGEGSVSTTERTVRMDENKAYVSINIVPAENISIYLVEEQLPAGMTLNVTNISDGGNYIPEKNVIRWSFLDGTPRTLAYTLEPEAGFVGTIALNGEVMFDEETVIIEGDIEAVFRPVVHFVMEDDGKTLILNFIGTLYESEDTVTWTEVEGAESPFRVDTTKGKKFYRCAQ